MSRQNISREELPCASVRVRANLGVENRFIAVEQERPGQNHHPTVLAKLKLLWTTMLPSNQDHCISRPTLEELHTGWDE